MSDIQGLDALTKQGEDYIWRPAVAAIAEIARLRAINAELLEALRRARTFVDHARNDAPDDEEADDIKADLDLIDAAITSATKG